MAYGNYPDLKSVKKILVVKMRHHGDVLLTSPVFSSLKNKLPDASIDAFIYQDTLPMLEGHPAIASFLTYDHNWKKLPLVSKLKKEWELLKRIRKNRYDLVINLTEGDRGAIAALASGSPIKVGFDPGKKGFWGKRKSYTHLVKNCSTPRHAVERQLDALRKIGIFPSLQERELHFHLPAKAETAVLSLIEQNEIEEKEYILFHPVSRWRFKCPPVSLMREVIRELIAEGKKIIVTSGPDPEECFMVDEMLLSLPQENILNLAGKTSLKELGVLIKYSQLLVCVDSVPLHMASALKAPVVVLFGPSSDLNWGPWQHPQSRVLKKDYSCRPCGMDGCGGSKMSDCLHSFSKEELLQAIKHLSSNSLNPDYIAFSH
jgi:heptosyltransferase-3